MSINPDDMKSTGAATSAQLGASPSAPVTPPGPPPQPAPPVEPARQKSLAKTITYWIAGFAISLVVGFVFQKVTDPQTLSQADLAQKEWMAAVDSMNPWSIVTSYVSDLEHAWNGTSSTPSLTEFEPSNGAGTLTPITALCMSGVRLWGSGGFWALVQLLLGGLAVAVYNHNRSNGHAILFEEA